MSDASATKRTGWQPIETAPRNESVLIWLPRWEHYGPGIYRAIQVDMGTGCRWHTTAWACGRDLDPIEWPKFWMPLPEPPEDVTDRPNTTVDRWGRYVLSEDEKALLEEVGEAFWGGYDAAPNGEGVMGAAEFGCIAAVLAATRTLKAPEAVARAIGEVGTYGVPRKYKLVPREPGEPL